MLRKIRHIVDFFNVSIIVPLFEGVEPFRKNLSCNQAYFRQNGIELIVTAQTAVSGLRQLTDDFPFLNWKIILSPPSRHNDQVISTLLNTGLQQAGQRYVLYMHPGTVLTSDLIYRLCYIQHHYTGCFTVADDSDADISMSSRAASGNGMVMVPREKLLEDGGFEQGDDFQHISRLTQEKLERASLRKMIIAEEGFRLARAVASLPDIAPFEDPASPTGVIYDWSTEKSPVLPAKVLDQFQRFSLRSQEDMSRQHQLICLMQIRNESHHLPDVLAHINGICDGIILLDDGSTDGSYERAQADNLLLKVQKNYTGKFNDLDNRNLLLQLAYLFRSEWFLFLDADERVAFSRPILDKILQMKEVDTVSFHLVHIWDKAHQYRKDLPEGRGGVLRRYRLFRSKGFMQIVTNRDLHFCVTPFRKKKHHSALLLLHYGLMDANVRKSKKDRYDLQDANGKKQGYPYDYLTDENPQLANLEDLISED